MNDPSSSEEIRDLQVGFSPCPNDTFIFHALVTGRVPARGIRWKPLIDDVEKLNALALERALPVTKISFHAFGHLRDTYALLRSGAALGRGCGPLVVARDRAMAVRLAGCRVAVPGLRTTAALLLRLFEPELSPERFVVMPFDRIIESVARGETDAGLIIHESRFTYGSRGLIALADLGEWWELESGLPIPLGGIIADRRLEKGTIAVIEDALRRSVIHARSHPGDSRDYVRAHAQEIAEDVARAHIDLYVNDFTEDIGDEGLRAVQVLFAAAESRGILPEQEGRILL